MSMEQLRGDELQGDAGVTKIAALYGTLAGVSALGMAYAGFNLLDSGSADANTLNSESPDWLNVVGQPKPDCIALVDAAGTGETYEQTIDGKERTLVKSDVGAYQDGRISQNSMRAPAETGPDTSNVEAELKAGFCEDAPFTIGTAHTLGNVIYKGKRLADTEDGAWLKPIADLKPEDLNKEADRLLGSDLESTDLAGHYDRYLEHTELAENLAAVLTNLNNNGLKTGQTELDVSYVDESFVGVFGIPEMVASNKQFADAEALMFGASSKGDLCDTDVIGFNMGIGSNGLTNDGDQRPETFVPVDCVVETTVTNPDGSTTTTLRGTTTTTNPDGSTTTTSWRTSNTVTASTVFQGPGDGGTPGGGSSTSTTANTATTDTTIRAGGSTTTTEAVPPTTDTTVITG